MKRVIRILLAIVIVSALMLTIAACDQDPCKDGHSWDDGSITKQPTCQAEGTILKRCMKCGAVEQQTLAKVGHDWGEPNVIVPPTCSTPGRASVKCKNCDETQPDEIIPATGNHVVNLQAKHEAVEATCWREGSIEYYDCQTCGSTVKLDADGNVLTDVKVAKTAHNYDNGVITKAPTCSDTGIKTFTCQNEGCTGDGHTFEQVLDKVDHVYGRLNKRVEPTCDTSGVSAYYQCEVCHKYFDESKQETEWTNLVIAALGHNYEKVDGKPATCTQDGFETYYKCDRCHGIFSREGEDTYYPLTNPVPIRAKGHDEKQIPAIEATCTKGGKTAGVECAVCGVILVTPKNTAPLGHQWGEWYEVQHPTCTEQGVMHRDCLRMCGATDEQTKSIPALGHNYVYTSDNDGVHHTVTCSRDCGYKAVEECASTGAWMSDNADYHYRKCDKCKGECDIANHTFQNKQCTVCGAEQSEVIVRVAGELDHTENSVTAAIEYIKQNYNDGKTPVTIVIGATRSANADVTFDGKIKVTLDLGNFGVNMRTFSLIVDEQADVTLVNGTLTGKVQFNGGKLVLSGVSGDYTIALKAGLKCDTADVTVNGTRLDHAWNNGQVTTPPTCEGTGTRTFTCTRCQATRTEDEPAKGHTYGALIPQQDPTCTATGTAAHYQCSDCHKLFIDENGSKKEVQADELVLQKLPHAYGAIHPMEKATCVTDGHKAYYQCESCKQYFDEDKQPTEWKDLVLTSGGHDYDTTQWQSNETSHWYACKNDPTHHDQEATHSWDYRKGTNGSHEHYCTVCGYIDKVDTTCSPAKPAPAESHDSTHGLNMQDGWYADADNHWQICEKCGETINKGAHDWVGNEGNKTCKDCGHKFFDVKISDGDGLDQSAPTIAAAFAWIESNGDNSKTYTVTLTHNRSDDSADAVTVPDGYTVVLMLGDYSVTYPNGKLSIGNGSTLTVTSGKGVLNIGTIEYNGGTLVLPDGEYNFKIINKALCPDVDITVGGVKGLTHKYDAFEQNGDFQHWIVCSVCGNKDKTAVDHDFDGSYKYNGNWTHTATCKDCGKQVTSNCKPELNVCKCGKDFTVDEILDKLETLNNNDYSQNWLPGTYVLSGTVTKVEHSNGYTNVWFTVEGDSKNRTVEVYGMQPGLETNVAGVIVGAKITVSGELQHYGTTLEFGSNKGKLDQLTLDDIAIDFSYDTDKFAYKIVSPAEVKAKYPVGTEIQFTVEELQAKWLVEQVTVNGVKVDPDESGIYKFIIEGATTVQIVGYEWGAKQEEKLLSLYDFDGGTSTARPSDGSSASTTDTFADSLGGDALKFTTAEYVYKNAFDNVGNTCLKLGASKNTAKIVFSVPANVTKVIIYVGVYTSSNKDYNTAQLTINGTSYEVKQKASEGKYEAITIDTSEVKTITLETTGGESYRRCMIDKIEFYGTVIVECTHPEKWLGDWDEGFDSTCTTPGELGHYTCQRCGKYIDDDKQTVLEDIVIKTKDHNLGEWQGEQTSEGTYQHYKECSSCKQHFETTPCTPNDAWEFDNDNHFKKCTVCSQVVETGGHTYTKDPNMCDVCGMTNPTHVHVWEDSRATSYVAPQCEKPGVLASVYCSSCEKRFPSKEQSSPADEIFTTEIAALGHNVDGVPFTHIDDEQHGQYCDRCEQYVNKDSHTFVVETGSTVDDTYHTAKCLCGDTKQEVHNFQDESGAYNKDCACGEVRVNVQSIKLDDSNSGIGSDHGYDSESVAVTVNGVGFDTDSVYKNGGMQAKASSGYIYNTTPFPGRITKIIIVYKTNNMDLYLSNTCKQTSGSGFVNKGTVTEWTAQANDNYTFFTLHNGSKYAVVTSITIYYEVCTHTWVNNGEQTLPDCATEQNGKQPQICIRCGEKKDVEIPFEHNLNHVEEQLPTSCKDTGYKAHWECENCGGWFEDISKDKIADHNDIAITKNHTYIGEDGSKTWTSDEQGHYYLCTDCGQMFGEDGQVITDKIGHTFVYTDNNDGENHHRLCTVCGWEGDEQHTSKEGPCDHCTFGHNYYKVGTSSDKQYATLKDAIDNLGSENTITLLGDVTDTSINEAITASFTLALGTNTLTLSKGLTFDGDVIITGSSSGDARGKIVAAAGIETLITANSTLEISGVTIDARNVTVAALQINGGDLTLTGGEIIVGTATIDALHFVITQDDLPTLAVKENAEFYVGNSGDGKGLIRIDFSNATEAPLVVKFTFCNEQKHYNVKFDVGTSGVTCDDFPDSAPDGDMVFTFDEKPISHSYVDQNDGNHKCDICAKSEAHKMSVVAESYNEETDEHTLKCSDCTYTETSKEHTYDQEDGSCACGKVQAKERELTIDFTTKFSTYANEWKNSYSDHDLTPSDLGVSGVEFNLTVSASKQTGTITNMPVTKSKAITLEVTDGGYLTEFDITFKQWSSKKLGTVSITITYGSGQETTIPGDASFSQKFDLSKYTKVTKVVVSSTNTSDQAGIQSIYIKVN